VALVPALRRLNVARHKCVHMLPPYRVPSRESLSLAKQVDPLQGALHRALAQAIDKGVTWQAVWSAMLLSDCSSLGGEATSVLQRAADSFALSVEARWTAQCALARHGAGEEGALWAQAPPVSRDARRRALLAAAYLMRHSKPTRWNAVRVRFGGEFPELVALLESWH